MGCLLAGRLTVQLQASLVLHVELSLDKMLDSKSFSHSKINFNVSMSHLSATPAAFMLTAYPLSQSETTFTSYLRLCDDVAAACKATNVEKYTAKYTGAFIVCVIHTSAYYI